MRCLAWIDGRVVEVSELPQGEPFVMQRIHTLNHCVYGAYTHVAVMRDTSAELFGFQSLATGVDVERIVTKLLDVTNAPLYCSIPVVMRLYASGALSFEVEEAMFGGGIYLRAKRLSGVVVERCAPTTICQTSESLAIDVMSDRMVRQFGGDVALWVDGAGKLISRPWRPIFVYHKGVLFTPKEFNTVEYRRAAATIDKVGMRLVVRDIPYEALARVEEVFLVDVMGLSSLGNVQRHRLMSAIAQRIADRMEL